MSVTKVREYLKQFGKENDIMEFPVSSATVELAAKAVGTIPARIAKTLSFLLKDGQCALIATAGDVKVDNRKYKDFFGVKAKMLTAQEVSAFTGHAVGGVCPFGIENDHVAIYLDESLQRFETVFPAAGSSNSAIELTPDDFFRISRAKQWIDVTKPVEI